MLKAMSADSFGGMPLEFFEPRLDICKLLRIVDQVDFRHDIPV